MATLYMCRGVPGSGKSTWAKQWVRKDPENRVRVSRDDIRAMLYATPDKLLSHEQEKHVSKVEKAIARAGLSAGKDVVIDATNLRAQFVTSWLHLAPTVKFVDFPVSLDRALALNAERENPLPENVV